MVLVVTTIMLSGTCIVLLLLTRIGRITHGLVGMPVLSSNDIITLLVLPVNLEVFYLTRGRLRAFLGCLVLVVVLLLRILASFCGLFNILIRIHKNHFLVVKKAI